MKKMTTALAVGGLLCLPAAASAHYKQPTPHPPTPPTCPAGTVQDATSTPTVLVCVKTVTNTVTEQVTSPCTPVETIKYVNVEVPGPVQYVDKVVTKILYKTRWKVRYKTRIKYVEVPSNKRIVIRAGGVTG